MKRTILEELLLADGIKLREGGGSDKMVLCWAHEEKTPSMSVNVAKGVYNCHGCGAKGNAYSTSLITRACPPRKPWSG